MISLVKYLVIRFSSIGDIVLTTPLVRCLKRQVPGAEVHFLTKKSFYPVIRANPYIDRIHVLGDSLPAVIRELGQEGFDYIIDLHRNMRSFLVKNRLRTISFTVDKINVSRFLMINLKINRLPDKHIVDRYLETLRVFDVVNDLQGLDYHIPPEDEVDISSLQDSFHGGYIALVPGAQHNTKQMPPEMTIRICSRLKHPVLLLGGEREAELGRHIAEKAGSHVLSACGSYNINQSASLIRQSRLVITHDTGLMHIAAAFRKNILSVWGHTIPGFGFYPYLPGSDSRIFEVGGLRCRPCTRTGKDSCPKGHFRCMADQDEEEIIRLANISF